MNVQLSSEARAMNFGPGVHLCPYFMYVSSECSGETVHLHRLARAFSAHIWALAQENLSSGVCEQQRCRPACTSPQTDQRHCYSLFGKYHI